MDELHPKLIRRRILLKLYKAYLSDPLDMPTPSDLVEDGEIPRENLKANAYYLHDRGLAEVLTGFDASGFAAARITADGIDVVEDYFEFNRRFPPEPTDLELATSEIPALIEQLYAETEQSSLDGEARRCLLRDADYLRDEVARPAERWRIKVLMEVMQWIQDHFKGETDELPSLKRIQDVLLDHFAAITRAQGSSRSK